MFESKDANKHCCVSFSTVSNGKSPTLTVDIVGGEKKASFDVLVPTAKQATMVYAVEDGGFDPLMSTNGTGTRRTCTNEVQSVQRGLETAHQRLETATSEVLE